MTGRLGRAVWLLALGQLLAYAAVYYSFAALLPDLLRATGWTKAQLAAGPTLAFLMAAVLAPLTGRLVDRGYARHLLAGMPVLAGAALVGLSWAGSPAVWLVFWVGGGGGPGGGGCFGGRCGGGRGGGCSTPPVCPC